MSVNLKIIKSIIIFCYIFNACTLYVTLYDYKVTKCQFDHFELLIPKTVYKELKARK